MMNRLVLMKVHAVLAAFVLPVAVMFMVTGSLYTLGVKGGYTDDVYEVALGEPLEAKLGVLEDFARMELDQRTISVPEGQPRLKVYGGHFLLEWTGSSKDVIVEPTDNALVAKLTVKHASWYRNLVQLHKAKGGLPFKLYAVVFAVSVLALLVSGYVMAWQSPKLKKLTVLVTVIGLLSFGLLVYVS